MSEHALRIRDALLATLHKQYPAGEALTINELGIQQGTVRADVAVVNGILQGFEIKSDADNLLRLPNQIAAYDCVFDKSTLVVGEKYQQEAALRLPAWWGVIVATPHKSGIRLRKIQAAKRNPRRDAFSIAQLLWKNETIDLLKSHGVTGSNLRGDKIELYNTLVETLTLKQLQTAVCYTLKNRQNWRDHSRLS